MSERNQDQRPVYMGTFSKYTRAFESRVALMENDVEYHKKAIKRHIEKIEKVEPNSVLHIKLDYEIKDRSSNNPFESFDFSSFESHEGPGLDKIIKSLEKAKTDDKIKGIFRVPDFIVTHLF